MTRILEISIDNLVFLRYRNQPVYEYQGQLSAFISARLGSEFNSFFTDVFTQTPYEEGKKKFIWSSRESYIGFNALSELTGDELASAKIRFSSQVQKILLLEEGLAVSDSQDDRYMSELIKLAISIPNEDYIFVSDKGTIHLTAWGVKEQKKIPWVDVSIGGEVEAPEEQPPSLFDPSDKVKLLPDKPRVIVPIEIKDEIFHEELLRNIIPDRLNICVVSDLSDVYDFARAFKEVYPSEEYQIIYYDDVLLRFQVRLPKEHFDSVYKDIKGKLSSFELLVFPESVVESVTSKYETKKIEPKQIKKNWYQDFIGLEEAWSVTKGSSDIKIAIVDDGFDAEHPSLKSNVICVYNGSYSGGGSIQSSSTSHGTHVAAIAAGSDVAIHSGVAPECKILAVQVADQNGVMCHTAFVDGLMFAIQNKANVINLSLGKKVPEKLLQLKLEEREKLLQLEEDEQKFWDRIFLKAKEQSTIVVFAAGNDDFVVGYDPMVRSNNILVVSAVDNKNRKAPFSNYGRLSTFSAPGVDINSAVNNGKYENMSGTSMAAPVVSGAIGLLLSANPNYTFDDISRVLSESSTKPTFPKGRDIGNSIHVGSALSGKPPVAPPVNGSDDNMQPPDGGDRGSMLPPKNKNGCIKKLLYLLLLLLFLGLLIFLFRSCSTQESRVLPDEPNLVLPVDTNKIIDDEDSIRKIISNRLNIILKDKQQRISSFAQSFKRKYPDDNFKVVYYDTVINRLQIEIPDSLRNELKKNLPDEFREFEMLIWEESLFEHNSSYNDPGFSDSRLSWYFEEIKAYDAWRITQGDSDLVVAVIDNGFDLSHPELLNKVVKPYNPFTKSGDVRANNSFVDGYAHGTHVAATAVGWSNNSNGISGIAPNCKLMPIKVSDPYGNIPSSAIIDGVLYAIYNGASVINMSLGIKTNPVLATFPIPIQDQLASSSALEEAEFWDELFEIAYLNNVSIVAAAGNEDYLIDLDPMKRSDKIIIVSAVNEKLRRATFSNFGETSTISAPGTSIYSAAPGNNYMVMDGTSMASPIVSGAVALIKSVNPLMQHDEIVELIQKTGIPVDGGTKSIGNLIQLSALLRKSSQARQEQPLVDCDEVQDKIDSLLLAVEKLKKTCEFQVNDTLKIPTGDSMDLSGLWKSTSDLKLKGIEDESFSQEIEIFFDVDSDGSGKVIYACVGGCECRTDVLCDFSGQQLIFHQPEEAKCSGTCEEEMSILPYDFICSSGNGGKAECVAKALNNNEKLIDFNLIRIR